MTAFGLVLGGGGPVGTAWYAGLANGLADEGLDIGVADVIMGTSAGASAGAWLASERSREFVDAMKRLAAGPEALAIDTDLIGQVCALRESAEAPLEPPDTQRIGELARRVPPVGVRVHANYLPGSDWPERFHALVVNVQTGEFRVLGRTDGPAVGRVLAEECRRLSEAGIRIETVLPTDVEKAAFGHDLLNYSKMGPAIEAGRTRARSEIARLRQLVLD